MPNAVAAVDLGASSGRVIVGRVDGGEISLETVHRFPNTPVQKSDGLHWDIDGLYRSVQLGLRAAVRRAPALSSVGVDSWAVDYALVRDGQMFEAPFHYRDARTAGGVEAVHARITRDELYRRNGLQFLPFNTLYQLAAEGDSAVRADAMLLVPDLISYWLSGELVCELTNASTTGLLGVETRDWDTDLIDRLALPRRIFQPLAAPGAVIGPLKDGAVDGLSTARGVVVTAVGSHDTASAVVGVPMVTANAVYISCGTWGLVGVELDQPVLTEESRLANFTNEGGVDGRIRFLRNVMGLWLLSESIRQWEADGEHTEVATLVEEAAGVTRPVPLFDVDDPRFLAPGDIPSRIRAYCAEHDQAAPRDRAELVRSILESLARAFARSAHRAAELSGRAIDVIHIVGGGSQNRLLCQLTADRSGCTVLAGPVEATALGNVLVQARAQGFVSGDLEELRSLVVRSFEPVRYQPRANGEGSQ